MVRGITRRGNAVESSHIAERYATLTVVTLGEVSSGTVALLQALIERTGWDAQTAVLGLAAMGVTFAMWWLYFAMPGGETLRERPERAFAFGYGSIPLLMACAAVGPGCTSSPCGPSTRRTSPTSPSWPAWRCR